MAVKPHGHLLRFLKHILAPDRRVRQLDSVSAVIPRSLHITQQHPPFRHMERVMRQFVQLNLHILTKSFGNLAAELATTCSLFLAGKQSPARDKPRILELRIIRLEKLTRF